MVFSSTLFYGFCLCFEGYTWSYHKQNNVVHQGAWGKEEDVGGDEGIKDESVGNPNCSVSVFVVVSLIVNSSLH